MAKVSSIFSRLNPGSTLAGKNVASTFSRVNAASTFVESGYTESGVTYYILQETGFKILTESGNYLRKE